LKLNFEIDFADASKSLSATGETVFLSANKLYEAFRFCQGRKLKHQAKKISINIK